MLTLNQLLADARHRLRDAGIPADEAALDARLLAQHVLGWDASTLLTRAADVAPAQFPGRFEALIGRRLRREPLAYIVGTKEFWDLSFEVSTGALIPRPETELLVEATLELFPQPDAPFRMADVCTGSGCVAVSVASVRPHARITATDTSLDALRVAERNVSRHRMADRVKCLRADLLEGIGDSFDLILANPPYVPEGDRRQLQPEVSNFEPAEALFAGPEGLDVIARLIQQSAVRLVRGGHLVFEFGAGQEPAIRQLISQAPGLTVVSVKRDLQGIPRVVISKCQEA